jgi:hypothetical protein
MDPKYIKRVVADFVELRSQLQEKASNMEHLDLVSATLVLAARLEAVEDALIEGLPTAGEGI